MPLVPTLVGDRVTLRAPQPSDAAARRRLGRVPEIVRAFGGDTPSSLLLTAEEAAEWYVGHAAEPCAWSIEVGGVFDGTARLHSFDHHEGRATFAIGILDPALLGRGLGTEATGLVLAYGFERLGLRRIGLRVLTFNERAIRCYERCGLAREGLERRAARIDGEWYDDVLMALSASEWYVLQANR